MTYWLRRITLSVAFFGAILAIGCGRSDLTVYVWGDGGVDGGDGGPCGPATCPTGCCDPSGACRTGTELNACGFGGVACNDCQSEGFDFCDSTVKACGKNPPDGGACDPSNCASGCCTTFMGMPACVSGASSLACGNGGVQCVDCATMGEECDPGSKKCVSAPCGPNTCLGCCAGNTCVAMQSDMDCGTGGLSCTNCTAIGEFCNQSTGNCVSTPPMCSPSTCPTGCCAGDICVTSEMDTQCGTAGAACQDCTTSGETCSMGMCASTCNPKTCLGCCLSNTCYAGFVNNRCGSEGNACVDCTSMMTTCDTLAMPRGCKGMTSCPATYGGCGSSVSTPVLSVTSGACASSDLADAQAACKGGLNSAPCQSFIATEPSVNAACATCLTPFYYSFNNATGIFNCVSPYVSSSCNHDTGCIEDCEGQSCSGCPPGSVASCRTSVEAGQCSSYWMSASCIATALFGTASFCSPTTYGGNYGAWLAGVGKQHRE
jgi:hypothetical protein